MSEKTTQVMRELYWMVIFHISLLFTLLKTNADEWSWHNGCILYWSIILELFIILYLYMRNIITTKQVIEIVAMYQTAFAMIVLNIVIGLFITYICVRFLCYIIFICYNSSAESYFISKSKGC